MKELCGACQDAGFCIQLDKIRMLESQARRENLTVNQIAARSDVRVGFAENNSCPQIEDIYNQQQVILKKVEAK